MARWVALCAFAGAAGAWAGGELPSSFGPGEKATYTLRYLGLTAASMTLEVGEPEIAFGARSWPICNETRTHWLFRVFPVQDRSTSWWDPVGQRTLGHDFQADEGGSRRRQQVQVDHARGEAKVVLQPEGKPAREKTLPVVSGTHDIATAAFALRNQPLDLGRSYDFPVFTGEKTFVLNATVVSRQTLKTPLGQREVFQLNVATDFSGKARTNRLTRVYLTTDPSHVPVRIEADFVLGTVEAEIVEYREGRGSGSALASATRGQRPQAE
ncbi:MAG: DUF3108 domain-containing protein [Deltaproteobacteria bacterium]|nr:DUF3108 domain-containing protein [Deltaproteobacteria bacterium]